MNRTEGGPAGADYPDIIYFTLFPWDHPYSSVSLSLSRIFARQHRVFYINHPLSVRDFITRYQEKAVQSRKKDLLLGRLRYENIPGLPDQVIGVQPPLSLPVNWLPPGRLYDTFRGWNNRMLLHVVRRVIRDYQVQDFIYLNCFNPFFAGVLPESFGPRLNIYQCIDDMRQEAYTARHGHRLEEEVIRQADITLVTSHNLYRLKSDLNPNTYILPNAADINIFRKATREWFPRPAEIAGVKGKIIGFIGNLNEYRIDYPLLRKIALSYPLETLLLVGPLNSDDYRVHGLDELPNVILTGAKDITELPRYLQYMDCAIIPFLCNEQTRSVYPLKINEYLAAGKAVVSTSFSEDIRSFAGVIHLAEDEAHFLKLINDAVAANSEAEIRRRIELAEQNTWENRVQQFWKIVHKTEKKNRKQEERIRLSQPGNRFPGMGSDKTLAKNI